MDTCSVCVDAALLSLAVLYTAVSLGEEEDDDDQGKKFKRKRKRRESRRRFFNALCIGTFTAASGDFHADVTNVTVARVLLKLVLHSCDVQCQCDIQN